MFAQHTNNEMKPQLFVNFDGKYVLSVQINDARLSIEITHHYGFGDNRFEYDVKFDSDEQNLTLITKDEYAVRCRNYIEHEGGDASEFDDWADEHGLATFQFMHNVCGRDYRTLVDDMLRRWDALKMIVDPHIS